MRMSAVILNGKVLAKVVRSGVAAEAAMLADSLGRKVGLGVVLVGDDEFSASYVRSKTKEADKCGIQAEIVILPAAASTTEVVAAVESLNARSDIDGILVQLPLPPLVDEATVLLSVNPSKDVDGLHPVNQGHLYSGIEAPIPCTPAGCMLLIEHAFKALGREVDFCGLHAVVVGRSPLVGRPMAELLLLRNCTVTLCHSKTKDLPHFTRAGDIVVVACGSAGLVRGEHLKPGAIVIDVGINRGADGKICGDVDAASAQAVAGALTPVPGGVGPMTVAMLLANVVAAARQQSN